MNSLRPEGVSLEIEFQMSVSSRVSDSLRMLRGTFSGRCTDISVQVACTDLVNDVPHTSGSYY